MRRRVVFSYLPGLLAVWCKLDMVPGSFRHDWFGSENRANKYFKYVA